MLFCSELAYYLSTDVGVDFCIRSSCYMPVSCLYHLSVCVCVFVQVREELYVDTSRGEKLRINFDIDFHRMPCLCECLMTMYLCLWSKGVVTSMSSVEAFATRIKILTAEIVRLSPSGALDHFI